MLFTSYELCMYLYVHEYVNVHTYCLFFGTDINRTAYYLYTHSTVEIKSSEKEFTYMACLIEVKHATAGAL